MRNDIFENIIKIVMSLGLVLLLVIVIWSCLEILSQESMETNGRKCLVIQIDDNLMINGVLVNTER